VLVLDAYTKKAVALLDERIEQKSDALAEGGAKDYAAYQRMVGEIAGLKFAKTALQEAKKNILQEEDDDD
jgi:hypothetical protein